MKFLCVPCDSPMKLQTVGPPDGGSLSVVYSCPECGYEMAMLTNPFETQLVQSLGVRIGPGMVPRADTAPSASAGAPVRDARLSALEESGNGIRSSGGRCPFGAMLPGMHEAAESAGHVGPAVPEATGRASAGGEAPEQLGGGEAASVRWTPGAEARLANIPAFVRPMARVGIEGYARERGAQEIDETILDAARDYFGM